MIKEALDSVVNIKLNDNRLLTGRLHAFDEHMNLVLEIGDDMIFLRGDGVVLLSV